MTNATTNSSPDKFVRTHRRAASEWSAASTQSYHSSEPLKREEALEVRVVIFVDVETEYRDVTGERGGDSFHFRRLLQVTGKIAVVVGGGVE